MHIETSLNLIINQSLERTPVIEAISGSDSPVRRTRAELEAYRTEKLLEVLTYCYERSSFYREHFQRARITPEKIRGLEELPLLPFTEPRHLSESPYRFLCTSQSEVARPYSFVTSGTTGPRKKIFWSQRDIERITDFMAAGIATVADPGDAVLILLPDGRPNSQADLLRQGVEKSGARPILADMGIDSAECLYLIQKHRCSVVFGYTRNVFRLSMDPRVQSGLTESGVNFLFLAADYLSGSMRETLRSLWGGEVRTHYGLTEMGLGVAVECEAQDGYHFNEADLLLEIVDPQTGETVPPGEEGELIFTTLTRESMPLLRYRTHDLSRFITEPCRCGTAGLLKIDKVKKRLESIVAIGDDDIVYPSYFDDALYEIPGVVDYQVVLSRSGTRDRLQFTVEMAPGRTSAIDELVQKLFSEPLITRNLAAGRLEKPTVEIAEWGRFRSAGRTKKLIADQR